MIKRIVYPAIIVVVSTLFAYLIVEAGVRTWLWHTYAKGNFKTVATWDTNQSTQNDSAPKVLGWGKANTTFYRWTFDSDSNLVWSTKYHINNVGFPSWYDYHPIDKKSEFGIAIVGDSFTASLQMASPWPDKLQDMLNADKGLRELVGGKTFKVYNFGLPAAGFPEFAILAKSAKAFDPDLVILNYIEPDFPRCNNCDMTSGNALEAEQRKLVSGNIRIPTNQNAQDDAFLQMTCEREPISFDNPTCRHSFSLTMPPQVAQNPELVRAAKTSIVNQFLRGQLWKSPYPYALRLLSGHAVSLQDFLNATGGGGHVERRQLTEAEMVAQATEAIKSIQGLYPGLMITLNPTFEDVSWKPSEQWTTKMTEQTPSIHVVHMRKLLPQGLSKEEYTKWFCLPYDGHMSDVGGELFAKATMELIKKRLEAGSSHG